MSSSGKTSRGGKGSTRQLTLASAASRDHASTKSPDKLLTEEEDEIPLIWQKMSDNLLRSFNERFDKFEQSFQSLMSAQQALTERLSTTENLTTEHEQRIHVVETCITELQKENKSLRAKLSDLEGRSRRNNIKIVGILEGEEKGRPTEFVSNLIPKLLGDDNFNKPVVIDRAHRTQQPKPPDGSRPRTIIARVHLAQEKEKILRLGRQWRQQGGARGGHGHPDTFAGPPTGPPSRRSYMNNVL